ncbi:MAG: beta strand repeat-containing protein [Pseudomonadota bacterium]
MLPSSASGAALRVRQRLVSLLLLAVAVASPAAHAQLTGTRTIPGDYPTLEAAVADLNTQGVGAGGVVIDLLAGNPQTAPAGGYRIATTTASSATPVRLQGNGNTITASAAHTVGAINDALIKIVGTDAVTITGFVLAENAANTVTAAATNNMTEWGIALLYATATDGARDVTLQGNTVDLNRTYQNTFGIYANATHSESAPSTGASATGPTGGHSGLRVAGNTITDVNIGIVYVGPTAAADQDATLTVGGATAPEGNTITNYGTTGTFSSYANVSGTVNGILVRNVRAATIAQNTIESSNGGTTAGTLRGIFVVTASTLPTGTPAHTITGNRISVRSGVGSGTITALQVESGAVNAGGSVSITGNDFHTSGHTVGATGAVTFVAVAGSAINGPLATTISNNTFTNLTLNTTGSATLIANSFTRPANGTTTVNNNAIVTQFSKTGAGGTVRGYDNFGSSPATATETNSGNTFSNVTLAAGTTTLELWRSSDGSTTGTRKTITNNTFNNIANPGTGNTIILNVSFSDSTFAGNNVSGNTVSNVSAGGTLTGIVSSSQNQNITGNTVHSLTATGTGTVTGILVSGGTSQVIAANKVYNLENSNAGGSVAGITASAGTTVEINNNLVGDLRGPNLNAGNSLIGISIPGGTTVNASFNTVRLAATSGGALFGSSALSASATTTVTLRNNILVNLSTANGSGVSAAYRRSSATLTSYGSASNNNDLFAGAPGPANVLFTDGTNSDQTLAAYRTRMAPRDGATLSVNPAFLSTVGASADFLHLDPAVPTQLESGGTPVAGIGTDFDGQARSATTPDIGADEFNGILLDLSPPAIAYTALVNTTLATNRTLAANIADPSGVAGGANAPRVYFRKGAGTLASTACAGTAPAYTCTIDHAAIGGVVAGDIVQYFVVAQDTAGNVGANPAAGFAATDVNTVTTPPTTPSSYTIVAPFPAALNVGTGETITSLTNTGGLFESLNAGVLTANVTVSITTDLAGETGAVALNPFSEEGAGGYTLTILPTGARTVVGASATGSGLLNFNGADRVTIDGLNTGGNSLLLRDTGVGSAVRWFNDASANRLRNTTVESGTGGTMVAVATVATTGNDNIEITGNTLRGRTDAAGDPSFNAVGSTAAAGAVTNSNLRIEGNTITNFRQAGVFIGSGTDGVRVTGNTISQTAPRTTQLFGIVVNGMSGSNEFSGNTIRDLTSSANVRGISVAASGGGSVFRGNEVRDLLTTGASTTAIGAVFGDLRGDLVERNRVILRAANATSTGAIIGIQFAGGSGLPSNANLVNNFVIVAPAPAGAQPVRGIFDFAFTGNTVAIDHNTVLVGGTASGSANSHAILRGELTPTSNSVRNNIALNTRTGGTGNHFAVGDQSLGSGTWTSNGNLFAGTGATPANYFDLGTSAAGTPVDFTAWRAGAPARDGASAADLASAFDLAQLFVDAAGNDLHLRPTATAALDGGIALPSVTTDIDGDPRSANTPDRGADELVVPNTAPVITPVGVSRREGDAGASATIANVSDAETAANALAVTVNGGASATVNGVTLSGISVSAGGVVSASVTAACLATSASFTLRATDAGGLVDEEPLAVTVLPNLAPTLSYTGVSVVAGGGTMVNPATGPTDSGTVQSVALQSTNTYTGGATVSASGVVTLSNAGPVGSHTLVIRATDNCSAITDASLPLTVSALPVDADLSIIKTSSLALAGNGVIQYTLQVGNAGPLGATGAVVADTFPASLSNATWTCTASGMGASCPASGNGNINAVVNLPNGSSLVFAITAQLPATPPGPIVNTATVTPPTGLPDPNTANNTSTVTDRLDLFANGFEPVPNVNVAVLELSFGTPGAAQRVALPVADIARAARSAVASEALAFQVGGALAVVQARRLDGRTEVRLLTFQADRSWQVGPWLVAEPMPAFEWTWLGMPGAQGTLSARLVPGS